jgi:hypothetical protein
VLYGSNTPVTIEHCELGIGAMNGVVVDGSAASTSISCGVDPSATAPRSACLDDDSAKTAAVRSRLDAKSMWLRRLRTLSFRQAGQDKTLLI